MSTHHFSDRVTVTINDLGIAQVTLARAEKMNALDNAMFQALIDAGELIKQQKNCRVVVLHGEGKAFCAGLDMANFESMSQGEGAKLDFTDLNERTHGIANFPQYAVWVWRSLPIPVIAALHGVALGGGLQLALAADLRIVAPQTRLSVLEIKWGLVPDMSGMALLKELVRNDIARELTYTGRMVESEEAVRIGLATRIAEDPLATALDLATQICHNNPDAIRSSKSMFNRLHDLDQAEILLMEAQEQSQVIGAPNQIEAATAALEKRLPNFK